MIIQLKKWEGKMNANIIQVYTNLDQFKSIFFLIAELFLCLYYRDYGQNHGLVVDNHGKVLDAKRDCTRDILMLIIKCTV